MSDLKLLCPRKPNGHAVEIEHGQATGQSAHIVQIWAVMKPGLRM